MLEAALLPRRLSYHYFISDLFLTFVILFYAGSGSKSGFDSAKAKSSSSCGSNSITLVRSHLSGRTSVHEVDSVNQSEVSCLPPWCLAASPSVRLRVCLPAWLPACLPAYPACLPDCLPACIPGLPDCLTACIPGLPDCLPACIPGLPACRHTRPARLRGCLPAACLPACKGNFFLIRRYR